MPPGNYAVFDGVQADMGISWTSRGMQRYANASVTTTLQVALAISKNAFPHACRRISILACSG